MPFTATNNSALTFSEVRSIQQHLATLGFDPGPIDGIYGPHTESAILAFKRSMGLRLRPWVGPQTWELLHQSTLDLGDQELPWLVEARKAMNLHEVYNNVALRRWLASDGHALGDPARLPWCGDFVETAIRLALPGETVPKNPYWALNWRSFGLPTAPTYGAVGSISRDGGGHVFFLVGQDKTRYYALGGNQSNKVSVVPIDKSRCPLESFRWPATYTREPINLPSMTSSATSSTNET
jgi:uncharacterized protein (TIGR02594 family)